MNLSLKKCLLGILQAMIVSWSVNILKLASALPSKAAIPSIVRRIERFLLRTLVKQHEAAQSIVGQLGNSSRFILSMDGTSWHLGSFKYYVLAVGICFDGIALPICFAFLPGREITNFTDEIGIMERVVSLLGAGRIECLLADREFGNGNFQKWLQIRGIKYCIRLRENLYMRKDGQKKGRKLRDVLASVMVGEHVILHDAYLMRKGVKARIYATRRIGRKGEESLIILASPVDFDCTDRLYRRRWTLETAFRGLKSAGFNMEDTHLGQKRFENMLTLLMIAFAAAFIEGWIKIRSLPIPLMKNRQVKRISIFRYGYVELLHDIWANVKNMAAAPS